MKILRSSSQSERSRDTSPSPEGRRTDEELDSGLKSSYTATIKENERQIDALRLELADMEVRLAEQANSANSRSRQVEEALLQAKLENIRLAENVESYQMLLQDRTLKGEYSIMGLEGVHEDEETYPSREHSPIDGDDMPKSTSLAAELEEAEDQPGSSKIKRNIFLFPFRRISYILYSSSIGDSTLERLQQSNESLYQ
jgi:hypothetical protein